MINLGRLLRCATHKGCVYNLNAGLRTNYAKIRGLHVSNVCRSGQARETSEIKDEINLNEISSESDAILLLQNSGLSLYNHSLQSRQIQLATNWELIKDRSTVFSIEVFNAYLQACNENETMVDHVGFLNSLKTTPNRDTYLLLLENACARGDVQRAVAVLGLMKEAGVAVDESVFNLLLLGHIIDSGLKGGKSVLNTMKQAQVIPSLNTHWAILKGLAMNKNSTEFVEALSETPKLPYDEEKFFGVLFALGLNENQACLRPFLSFLEIETLPRQSTQQLESVCVSLVHRGCADAAMLFYRTLAEPTAVGGFGNELLREMMLSGKIPLSKIIDISNDLSTSGLNEYALSHITEVALREDMSESAYTLFKNLPVLRTHYFWPLLLSAGRKQEERGVLEVLEKMSELNTKPDHETLEHYILKFCDLSSPEILLKRFQRVVKDVKLVDVVSPILAVLLRCGRTQDARDFYEHAECVLSADKLIVPLAMSWKATGDVKNVSKILQVVCETNSVVQDWTGMFLLKVLKGCREVKEYEMYFQLVKKILSMKLTITAIYAESILHILKNKAKNCNNKEIIEGVIDKLMDVTKHDPSHFLHPRDMNLEELECHLSELTNKNMETRGVLRRLIQLYAKTNNYERAFDLRAQFKANGYDETPGMKSSLFHLSTQSGSLEYAGKMYDEIKKTFATFKLDPFKIIDYAALLIANGRVEEAIEILTAEQRKDIPFEAVERNCWRAIGAASSPANATKVFKTLLQNGYCKPTNIILGPVVRSYLKQGDIPKAVEMYCKFVDEYKCTPLQLELLGELIDIKNDELLGKVLSATAIVHGLSSARITLVAALAEKGLENAIQKILAEMPIIPTGELKKRCDRWVSQNKLLPLVTLMAVARRNKALNLDTINLAIIRLYGIRNDCESALSFWKELEEKDMAFTTEMHTELVLLLQRCHYEMPDKLRAFAR